MLDVRLVVVIPVALIRVVCGLPAQASSSWQPNNVKADSLQIDESLSSSLSILLLGLHLVSHNRLHIDHPSASLTGTSPCSLSKQFRFFRSSKLKRRRRSSAISVEMEDSLVESNRKDTESIELKRPSGFLSPLPATRKWPSSLTKHVVNGIWLAIYERVLEGGFAAGLRSALRLAQMVVKELVVFPSSQIPFALRTLLYRSSTMKLETAKLPLEVYTEGGMPDGPLVLFVHGGSWGQGAPWQYALLARRLLQHGASKVAIATYSLFPSGDINDMRAEIGAALKWCRRQQQVRKDSNASAPPLRVVVAAQSAGAHLCALHFSHQIWHDVDQNSVSWLPDRFVALSGVYDIAWHFAHERTRLVHWLSPMWRAMMGKQFSLNGTAADIMADAMLVEGNGLKAYTKEKNAIPRSVASVLSNAGAQKLDSTDLSCESLALNSRGPAATSTASAAGWSDREMIAWAAASPTKILQLRHLVANRGGDHIPSSINEKWPPTVVLHAADDATVPVKSARDFVSSLKSCGVSHEKLRYEEYESGGHGAIMISLVGQAPFADLPSAAQDFLKNVCEFD